MRKIHLLPALLIIACPAVWACKPPPENLYYQELNKRPATMMLSSNGQYMMKMIPGHFTRAANGEWKEDRASQGVAYKITQQGKLEQLWTIRNVFPSSFLPSSGGNYYLADDGVHLVKVSEAKSLDDKNALTIYNRGQLFRSYAPRTFLPDFKDFRIHSCGSGGWTATDYKPYQPDGVRNGVGLVGTTLFFKAVDGKLWEFDIRQPPK